MIREGHPVARSGLARMAGHRFMVLVEPDQRVAGLEPQGLADQPEGNRVQALGELDVGVPMDFHFRPHRQHRRGGR